MPKNNELAGGIAGVVRAHAGLANAVRQTPRHERRHRSSPSPPIAPASWRCCLPEYGIDPTGVGKALGLTGSKAPASRTIEVKDVIGGNERVREVEMPAFNEPVPLPNPAVHQAEERPIQRGR